jgi:hypothetical protein
MDPFLEHPDDFPDLHGRFHVHLSEALQAKLPAPYFAVINERLWVETAARYVEPDTDVMHGNNVKVGVQATTGIAVLGATRSRPIVFAIDDDERSESFVEIRTRRSDGGERVVATIEVLSLSNKLPGEKGRELYLKKQQEILASDIHLVEIDLLRAGLHTTPIKRERIVTKVGPFDYHASIHRYDEPEQFFIYPWRLDEQMPEIAVPLLPGDGEVGLDLQAVFNHCYDAGPYRRRVQYDPSRLVPPLSGDRLEWVSQVVSGVERQSGSGVAG